MHRRRYFRQEKSLLAHTVSQVQQIHSSPTWTQPKLKCTCTNYGCEGRRELHRYFTGFVLHPRTHPSYLVSLTYELEQYFPFERYVGNPSLTANLSHTAKQVICTRSFRCG